MLYSITEKQFQIKFHIQGVMFWIMKEESKISKMYIEYEAIYGKFHKLVLKFIYDHISKEDEMNVVEDIFQATWLRVYEKIEMFSNMGDRDVVNYLRAMVRNAVYDHHKKLARESSAYENYTVIFHTETYEDNFEDIEELADGPDYYLKRAKAVLNEEEKMLIEMFYDSKMSGRAISEVLGISEANVRVRLKRVRAKLKKEIAKLEKLNEGGKHDERQRI